MLIISYDDNFGDKMEITHHENQVHMSSTPSHYVAFMRKIGSKFWINTVAIRYVCHVVSCAINLPAFLFLASRWCNILVKDYFHNIRFDAVPSNPFPKTSTFGKTIYTNIIPYCDTHENSGISCSISYMSYLGQCDLINTCIGLLRVWHTLENSMCKICHLTSKESIFTLIGSYWPLWVKET